MMWESHGKFTARIRLLIPISIRMDPPQSSFARPVGTSGDPALFAPPSGPTCFRGTDQQQVTHPVAGSGDDPDSFWGPRNHVFFSEGEGYWIFFFWNTFSCTPTFDYRAVVEFFFGFWEFHGTCQTQSQTSR